MTIHEKARAINDCCDEHLSKFNNCKGCPLWESRQVDGIRCYERQIDEQYQILKDSGKEI
mgnify:CR=1 FL=1